jgi:hypothetical protein
VWETYEVDYVAGVREMLLWFKSLKGRNHSKDIGADGRIILKWILRK